MTAQAKEFTLGLIAYAVQRGVDVEELCVRAALDLNVLAKNDPPKIAPVNVERLWTCAKDLCNDPLFGLHFGESLQISALGVVGEIIKSSNTVGEALQIALSLVPLVTDRFTMTLPNKDSKSYLYLIPNQGKESLNLFDKQMADFLMAFTIHELDGLLLKRIKSEEASLPHIGIHSSELKRVLRCEHIKMGPPYFISLEQEILKTPILTRNHQIQKMLLEKVRTTPDPWQSKTVAYSTRIYNYLVANAYWRFPTLEDTAANFNISPRSLQRRLKNEGKSFLQIAEAVKKSLAVTYLASAKYPIKEISYILGYNDQSAFSRAFKRWTGKTPIEFG